MARQRRVAPRWRMFVIVVLTLLSMFAVRGYVHEGIGSGGTPVPLDVPALNDVGSVLDVSTDPVRSATPAARTVALTFDDGPDPTWTPRILDVLERYDVPATFFVIGSKVVEHPEITAATVAAGHEVGNHTFTHVDLDDVPGWHARIEMSLTQAAITGATGLKTAVMRPPYSSTPSAMDDTKLSAYTGAAGSGYLVVLSDYDSRDWAPGDARTIASKAMPTDGAGGTILLHDGGGDRSETVEALDQLIPRLQAQGYRFVTASEVAGYARGTMMQQASAWGHVEGKALVVGGRIALGVSGLLLTLMRPLVVLFLVRNLVCVALAWHQARRRRHQLRSLPPISVLVPAHNEERGIASAVRSILVSEYPVVEVIVIDDGSDDATADVVEALDDPRVVLIRQANTGKPGALNAGLARASHELVAMVDGDTTLDRRALLHLAQAFSDPRVAAVSGNAKVANRQGLLGLWQHLEYVQGFNLDRRMFEALGCIPTIPGAIGAYRRQVLVEVGGVSDDTLAEDTDLTMSIMRAGWKVAYEQRAVAWTEAPVTLSGLWNQRYRWSYGTMQAMWKHRSAAWGRREGRLGRRALPYLVLFQVVLPLLGPVIDLTLVYAFIFGDPARVLPLWLAFALGQMAVAAYALHLDKERLRDVWAVPLQQLMYRQFMYLVLLHAVGSAVLGRRLSWMKVPRTGEVGARPTLAQLR